MFPLAFPLRFVYTLACLGALWLCLSSSLQRASSAYAEEPVDFSQVRQILSDKCFLCHGSAEDARQADLRLDVRDVAIETGAIHEGDAPASELIRRITSKDPDAVMPPPSTGKSISVAERHLLEAWINQGAQYSGHWAFTVPVRPAQPTVMNKAWIRNPIDRFVLAEQEGHGLIPSPAADITTLARRVSLDLVGLPPQPDEVDALLANSDSDAAYINLTEQLLASEHFGERWARWWLDAARYSDSDGYEKDKPRSVWFYRDWVIRSLNANLPYDQFVIHQIAGDLLPGAGQDEKVATGFLRNSMVNEEGGADPEQFRVEGMFDRLDAIGKAILGVTTQCAQCHTHKFDPLSQREYYQMFAALNDFHEATMTAFTPSEAAQRDSVLDGIAMIENRIKQRTPDWNRRLDEWSSATAVGLPKWQTIIPTDLPWEGQKFRLLDDGSIVSESYAPTKTTNTFTATVPVEKVAAMRLEALTHPQLPRGGPGRSIYGTAAVTEFEATIAPADQPAQVRKIKFARAIADANPSRTELPAAFREKDAAIDKRVTGPIEYAIDGDNQTAWSTDVGPGRRNVDRVAVFVPGESIPETGEVILSFTLKQNHGGWNSDDNQNYILGRYRFSITGDAVSGVILPAEIQSILLEPASRRTPQQQARLFSYWRTTVADFATDNAEIEKLWEEYPETDTQLVVETVEKPRQSFVLARGDFLNRTEPVEPAAPVFLGAMEESNAPARLRFARWLVRRDAPTTARVIVNRIWQTYFGRGLVTSPEDLGFQSAPPSHPRLLDWLAVELMDNHWNLKHIHRLIVGSATYRQSSVVMPQLAERDPQNVWLARGARFRVDAESVRDIALCASGLMNETVGGPSVFPPAPAFLFEPPASYGPKVWNLSTDTMQYRRSLYVHSYRSVPYPAMQVFDAPKGDAACIRRERSNTPLQALVMLNEPQFVECARALAERILNAGLATDNDRLQFAHRLAVTRHADPGELKVLQELLDQQRQRIAQGKINPQQLLTAAAPAALPMPEAQARELAAWFVVSRALLNLDELITKQ